MGMGFYTTLKQAQNYMKENLEMSSIGVMENYIKCQEKIQNLKKVYNTKAIL